ncbi:glutathione peroxidase [Sporosarcina sp. PTS2304]|uniref:glutathione peroxidase n=1 Tax=Sporosarcina sp. PTS2304 TaxID=2283194 RepID=UPI000E0DDE79|nr:glutathione peroxidase [Sporosarcina sp. PTS2304]AXI00685.1 glutathione peroxidase [Sporosarcina sp. PTS2304]
MTTVYDFTVQTTDGGQQTLQQYDGHPMIIVNTASKCGFIKQFKELQQLYEEYKDQGLVILGFPSDNFNNQEFDNIEETLNLCQVNYGVTFPMFAKIDVKGDNADPLFTYLTEQQKGLLTEGIKWNFTKFLIDPNGQVVERFAPQTNPLKMQKSIEKLFIE